jgi:uncharacterized membrane protein
MRVEIMALMIPILAIVGFFSMIVFMRFFQNMERMKMIEKGMNPADLENINKNNLKISPSITLKVGLLALGSGLGIIAGAANEVNFGDAAYPGCLLMGGGLGLIISYIIQLILDKKNKN